MIELSSREDVFIFADKSRVYPVIFNLLDNAIKFTNEEVDGGNITITFEKKNSSYVIASIKDAGKGIDPEILPRLFTKFATKSAMGGTGLGLFISKSIVEDHGGRIWAENNSNGKGFAFYFSLPFWRHNPH